MIPAQSTYCQYNVYEKINELSLCLHYTHRSLKIADYLIYHLWCHILALKDAHVPDSLQVAQN